MKKFFLSLIGGLIIGLLVSFLLMDYQHIAYEIIGQGGVDRFVSEMDFDFLFNSTLLVLAATAGVFFLLSYFERKKEQQDFRDLKK